MKRWWWLVLLLLLSVGINIGLLASLALRPRPVVRPPQQQATYPADSVERLADRLRLEGPERRRFLELHRTFFGRLRRALPRLEQRRRELYREMFSPRPDEERLRVLLRQLAELTVGVERGLVELTLETRQLLDDEQERLYLRFLARRMRPVREVLRPVGSGPPRREEAE